MTFAPWYRSCSEGSPAPKSRALRDPPGGRISAADGILLPCRPTCIVQADPSVGRVTHCSGDITFMDVPVYERRAIPVLPAHDFVSLHRRDAAVVQRAAC